MLNFSTMLFDNCRHGYAVFLCFNTLAILLSVLPKRVSHVSLNYISVWRQELELSPQIFNNHKYFSPFGMNKIFSSTIS